MERSKAEMWNIMVADCFQTYPGMQLDPNKSYSMGELKARADDLGLLEDSPEDI